MAEGARCPYCRGSWEPEEAALCPGCGTVTHRDCWLENRGCAILGCSESPDHAYGAATPARTTASADPTHVAGAGAVGPATPPPGWHADPYGGPDLRWWDGNEWTSHTHPVSTA